MRSIILQAIPLLSFAVASPVAPPAAQLKAVAPAASAGAAVIDSLTYISNQYATIVTEIQQFDSRDANKIFAHAEDALHSLDRAVQTVESVPSFDMTTTLGLIAPLTQLDFQVHGMSSALGTKHDQIVRIGLGPPTYQLLDHLYVGANRLIDGVVAKQPPLFSGATNIISREIIYTIGAVRDTFKPEGSQVPAGPPGAPGAPQYGFAPQGPAGFAPGGPQAGQNPGFAPGGYPPQNAGGGYPGAGAPLPPPPPQQMGGGGPGGPGGYSSAPPPPPPQGGGAYAPPNGAFLIASPAGGQQYETAAGGARDPNGPGIGAAVGNTEFPGNLFS